MTNGTKDKASAGDPIPVIEVHVGELKQLFNAIDPSPFRDKDLARPQSRGKRSASIWSSPASTSGNLHTTHTTSAFSATRRSFSRLHGSV
jgi:hypothetical protein